ncbi:MAG: phenylalanine--tRNA ligase subunit beta [Oscillospiraceae bacterium]|nr:phenylalanine--tRNA ligase subunit beta [Oscillospiraceae bacterium]
MNISRKWLNEYTKITATDKEFDDAMTMSGTKVETTEVLSAEIKNVVVGKGLEIVRHENSDHMWVCLVDVGEAEPIQIVTGAQNVKQGDLCPVAKHNSYLPGGIHITKGKLRGEKSNGMLCSLKELGLTVNDFPYAIEDGIFIIEEPDVYVGQDINEVIGTDDSVVEFEITNNRTDCYSIIGIAREAAATFNQPLTLHEPEVKGSDAGSMFDMLDVEVEDTDLCPRYTARMVANVKIGPSPKWLRQRLHACGVRPINNIVDITNYVMLEYGQPMHAFDYRYVGSGKIIVRRAKEGEVLTTLDGNAHTLTSKMLVIADEEKAIGLAGIMGGQNSEILDTTTTVVFESANFDGTCIRQTANALGMRTDASTKFEKGLDPLNTYPAIQRACELVEMLGAGDVMDGVIDVLSYVPQPVTVPFEPDKINRHLGTDISPEEMLEYLGRLGFEAQGDMLKVPSWRSDIHYMADVAEEVARLYGYNRIPTTMFKGATAQGGYTDEQKKKNLTGILCRALGYSEILTYSFGSPSMFDMIRLPEDSPLRNVVKILNPLGEDTSVMRTTSLPCMMETLARNNAYRNKSAKLYELAKIYLPQEGEDLPREDVILTMGVYGSGTDFFTLKGEIEAVLRGLNTKSVSCVAQKSNPSYHPGRCADLLVDGEIVGVYGQVHPLVAANYGISAEVYCAEINFTKLLTLLAPEAVYQPLPRFPAVERDLALICDDGHTAAQVEACIMAAGGKLLRKVRLFDLYRGKGIPEGKKSLAFNLELRADDRTLTDADSEGVISAILEKLRKELGITLR